MIKTCSAALLTASAIGSLLLLPAAPAYAQSPACAAAIDAINAAIDESGGNLDPTVQQSLATKLSAIDAEGAEKEAIAGYARALTDDSVPSMDTATNELNRVCKG
ncbi:hypothetical protein OHA40_25640 [Nocardia sp. NBC_00508]|uniref:hypothetical protein n=1 Tax=Nocardia sp. NBC_00508 TaxID=2975992 RepID=UPI002E81FD62|nr:hypothetical protein [Nocardia sp. NBC_00508]WUD65017.1 hypothetical protein OHA40_25640 [Nocardia sp. NBC_00508]